MFLPVLQIAIYLAMRYPHCVDSVRAFNFQSVLWAAVRGHTSTVDWAFDNIIPAAEVCRDTECIVHPTASHHSPHSVAAPSAGTDPGATVSRGAGRGG